MGVNYNKSKKENPEVEYIKDASFTKVDPLDMEAYKEWIQRL